MEDKIINSSRHLLQTSLRLLDADFKSKGVLESIEAYMKQSDSGKRAHEAGRMIWASAGSKSNVLAAQVRLCGSAACKHCIKTHHPCTPLLCQQAQIKFSCPPLSCNHLNMQVLPAWTLLGEIVGTVRAMAETSSSSDCMHDNIIWILDQTADGRSGMPVAPSSL